MHASTRTITHLNRERYELNWSGANKNLACKQVKKKPLQKTGKVNTVIRQSIQGCEHF